ncbi:archaeosine biosynthesis radical SAM protein RaSEA [Methanolacinia paynteri]|uniref:archaeosine biosynthesis radical SAM protein RaSEA n=1 Tax=Methanolacinia paynteri TaxID=230356 RepID=UPI00064F82DB|nr:archaeosine biosynthesis radical SAM protein RaSEA [Methanolacinia paynteri]
MILDHQEKPLASWTGKDRIDGKIIDCLTIIFKTGGCSWNRCLMCGYKFERHDHKDPLFLKNSIISQLNWISNNYETGKFGLIKIFTSGSFLDPVEVPEDARNEILVRFRDKIVIFETRPEYVNDEVLDEVANSMKQDESGRNFYISMGLETTNDKIREKCIDKGNTFNDFRNAAEITKKYGAGVKTYLMMKPLFLSERESIEDMKKSIHESASYSDLISMNVCTVQSKTEVEYYWKRGAYRPAYLWSVIDVLVNTDCGIHITCDPVGGGKKRGPHNCGICDYDLVDAINNYSLNADREYLKAHFETDCKCKNEWEFILENERPYGMPLTS